LTSTEEKIQPSRKQIRHSRPMRIEINCFLSSYTTDHSAHIHNLDLSFLTDGCRILLLIWTRRTGACISTMQMLGWIAPRPRRPIGELTCHDSKRSKRRLIQRSSSTTRSRLSPRWWRDWPRLIKFVMLLFYSLYTIEFIERDSSRIDDTCMR
jgi:hypothetical protein